MAAFAVGSTFATGTRLAQKPNFSGRTSARVATRVVAAASPKKVISLDTNWAKQFWGTGIFLEDNEAVDNNYLKKVEEKKLLSTVEGLGLLSFAEKNGITLSKIEKLGLLSTAEDLGLLSLAEKALSTSGATIASLSLPFFVLAFLTVVLVPDDSTVLVVSQYLAALTFAGVGTGLVAGGNLVNYINE